MNDLERRLEHTLDVVARSTSGRSRVDEIVGGQGARWRSLRTVTALAIAIAAIAVPLVLTSGGSPSGSPVGTGDEANAPPASERTFDLGLGADDIALLESVNDGTTALATNEVWCLESTTGTPGVAGRATTGVGEPLTEDGLIEYCRVRFDQGASGYTVCLGSVVPDFRRWFAFDDQTSMLTFVDTDAVDLSGPAFPVVLGWVSDCVSEEMSTRPPITLHDPYTPVGEAGAAIYNLDHVNNLRSIESAAVAAARRECLSREDAWALALAVHKAFGSPWMLASQPTEWTRGSCQGIMVIADGGVVLGPGREAPPGSSQTTIAPSDSDIEG